MSKSLSANSKGTTTKGANTRGTAAFAGLIVVLAVVVSFAMGSIMPGEKVTEPRDDEVEVAEKTVAENDAQPMAWPEDEGDGVGNDMGGGWGAAAVAAASASGGFSTSGPGSGASPFGSYTPSAGQERTASVTPSRTRGGPRRISRAEARGQHEMRGDGTAVIPVRPVPVR